MCERVRRVHVLKSGEEREKERERERERVCGFDSLSVCACVKESMCMFLKKCAFFK